jgi:hypothetical protein
VKVLVPISYSPLAAYFILKETKEPMSSIINSMNSSGLILASFGNEKLRIIEISDTSSLNFI